MFKCPSHFKCDDSYCVPIRHRCDTIWDCPYGEDENDCIDFKCTGLFFCPFEQKCLSYIDVCDNKADCKETKIDEHPYLCDDKGSIKSCPDECFCVGYAIQCIGKALRKIPDLRRHVKALLLNDNVLSHFILTDESLSLNMLMYLDLSFNQFLEVKPMIAILHKMLALKFLNFAFNKIKTLDENVFLIQGNLSNLNITNNPIQAISPQTFQGLLGISHFTLSNTSISILCNFCFAGLEHTTSIEILNNKIYVIEHYAFGTLSYLTSIVIQNNRMKQYDVSFIQIINSLEILRSDVPGLCCQVVKLEKLMCEEVGEQKIQCTLLNFPSFWLFEFVTVLIFNIGVILTSHNKDIFSNCIQNISLSHILLGLHYGFRIFLNLNSSKIILSRNKDILIMCTASALLFPLSQLIQVSMYLCYSICYLILTVAGQDKLPKLIHSYGFSVLAWILCPAFSYLIVYTSNLNEDICFPSLQTVVAIVYSTVTISVCLVNNGLAFFTIRKATQMRKLTGRKENMDEKGLKVRQMLHSCFTTLHCILISILYILISRNHTAMRVVVVSMDSILLIKSVTDPLLLTFCTKSYWQKLCRKDVTHGARKGTVRKTFVHSAEENKQVILGAGKDL